MALITKKLIKIYQDRIDELINELGKNVLLVFEETITNIKNEFYDPITGEISKPLYDTTTASNEPNVTQNTKIIKALTLHNPRDFESFNLRVDKPQDVIRLKTFATDIPDLKRCKYLISNYDIAQLTEMKYKMLREPVPAGLQEDRYAISFWERI
jgi:hypothetical protein